MKVLLTGMTARQANTIGKRALNYFSAPTAFYDYLTSCKFEVDWRPVQFGENLSKYDAIFIGIANPNSLSNVNVFSSIWATQWPHILYVDDWQVSTAFGGYTEKNLFRQFMMNKQRAPYDAVLKNKKKLLTLANKNIVDATDLLAPMFPWGNHSLLTLGTNLRTIVSVDPSPYYHNRNKNLNCFDIKKKKWVCAALYDYTAKLEKLGFNMKDVIHYHSKNKISESALVDNIYPHNWGVISVPYKHAGSGWWRARYNHAVHVGSILWTNEEESRYMGGPYKFISPSDMKSENVDLRKLATTQREWFFDHIRNESYYIKKMRSLVNTMKDK